MVSVLDPFPTVLEPKVFRPVVGTALKLGFEPPDSYPPAEISWRLETPNSGYGTENFPETTRISVDYHGQQKVKFQQRCCATTESIFNMEYFDFCLLIFGVRALRYISTWKTWA